MGNIIDKISNNKTEILSAATFVSVVAYLINEAIEKKKFREFLSSKKESKDPQAIDFITQMNQVYLKEKFNTHEIRHST